MQKTKYFHDILIPPGAGVGRPLKTENKLIPRKKNPGQHRDSNVTRRHNVSPQF